MTTKIYFEGKLYSEGKNLAVLNAWAKRCRRVEQIVCERRDFGRAFVQVRFNAKWRGACYFADYGVALEWAKAKSRRRGTWWTGCVVVEYAP